MKIQKYLFCTFVGVSLVALSSCSSGDSDDSKFASVWDIDFSDSSIGVNEETTLEVEVTYARERIFDDNDNLIVKVLLPPGVLYDAGSARVAGTPSDDDVDPETVLTCVDGSQILTFNLDDQDLENADNAPGDADATLKLEVRGIGAVGSVNVDGRAGYNFTAGDCLELIPQATSILTVSP